MEHRITLGRWWSSALAFALVAVGTSTALGQMSVDAPMLDGLGVDNARLERLEDPHAEMERLFKQVERYQLEIDQLLGRARESSHGNRGELATNLKASESRARDVVTDIDHILKLAGHAHSGTGT